MTRAEAIRMAGPYYHVTPAENVPSILADGLLPEKCDAGNYSILDPVPRPRICISPAVNRTKYIRMIRDVSPSGTVALLEIETSAVAGLNCELDSTNTELACRKERLRSNDFAALLLDGADLMCFDQIPPGVIRVVPITPP